MKNNNISKNDDDLELYINLNNEELNNNLNSLANDINLNGEKYIEDINLKKIKINEKRVNMERYIFNNTDEYTLENLNELEYNELLDLYNYTKSNNSIFKKIYKIFK